MGFKKPEEEEEEEKEKWLAGGVSGVGVPLLKKTRIEQ
jgi:hypothetical protein